MNPIHSCSLVGKATHLLGIVSLASLASLPMTASGALAIGVSTPVLGDAPDSSSDLVNTGSPDLLFYSSTAFGFPTNINDGIVHYSDELTGHSWMAETLGDFPAISSFYLNTAANPLGYEISQFRIFSLNYPHNEGLSGIIGPTNHHHYKIDYSVVGSADFETLGTVDISGVETSYVTAVTINPIPPLTGVDVIRFTWLDPFVTAESATLIAEVDIEGTPVTQVPEPSSILLGGVLLGTVCMRRKRATPQGR